MSSVTSTAKLVIAVILSLGMIINPFVQFAFHGGIDHYFDEWSETDEYTGDCAIELKKDPKKDFVILNFSDVQLSRNEVFGRYGEVAEDTIKRCIEETKPDLITLSGDNAWCNIGYVQLVKVIDSYGIPWAAVMGNHDGGNGQRVREAWDSFLMYDADNCVFKFGPKGMGYGNYVINITENGKIIHSLFMLDSHTDADDTEEGKINYGKNGDGTDKIGYDHFWANQIEWYKWAVKGIAKQAGHTVESSAIMHIPVYEYRDAAEIFCDISGREGDGVPNKAVIKEEYRDTCFGSINERICSAEGTNGFFKACVDLGSTKNLIAGHDHVNDISMVYEGIRLSYSLKCGPGAYWTPEKNGGSTLTIDSDGHATFAHHYVEPLPID